MTVGDATDMLAKASAMSSYASQLKAGIDIERPISLGVLKIKAKIGELMPAKQPGERGQGRGGDKSIEPDGIDLSPQTRVAYRKLAKSVEKLDEYYESTDDVPTQSGFISYAAGVHVGKASGENEWYTPPVYVEAAREAMGGIDMDPASCDIAQAIVKAKKHYTIKDDGLSKKWRGRVFLNPPYSKELCGKFVEKLTGHVEDSHVTQACVLVNNATETAWGQDLLAKCSAVCFIAGRIKFLGKTGEPANSPLQGQMVVYFGDQAQEFSAAFALLGSVLLNQSREGVGTLDEFRRSSNRMDTMRRIVNELEPHEATVARDWILERINQ